MTRVGLSIVILLTSGLMMTACLPALPDNLPVIPPQNTPVKTSTPTTLISQTFIPTATLEGPSIAPFTSTLQFTPIPSLTPTDVQDFEVPLTLTTVPMFVTGLPPTIDTGTKVEPSGIDKLLPNTAYKPAHILNKSGKPADINLDCTTNKGQHTVFAYHDVKNLFTSLPEGEYSYDIFVGGRQLVGGFSFMSAPKLFITIYKDRVAIH